MTFCTFSRTNHALTAFPICEGVGFTDSIFMTSASSRKSSISGVATCVPTPIPLVSESDEKKELEDAGDDGEMLLELVRSPTPKFKTKLLVSEDTDDGERLSTETVGDGTTSEGDGGGGGGGGGGASDPILILLKQSLLLLSVAIDLSFSASCVVNLWKKNFLSSSEDRVNSLLLP